ncbi:MAG: DUF6438 domain-containing protein, partial [Saprospiraceae bacterium]
MLRSAVCLLMLGWGSPASNQPIAAKLAPLLPMTGLLPEPVAAEPVADTRPVPKRSLVASLRRTACFGSCPVFLVEIWSDGQVVWLGEQHVARIGRYSAQVSPGWITALLQAGETAGFFDLNNQYPPKSLVPDLPLTITMLRQGHHQHQVVDNADAP